MCVIVKERQLLRSAWENCKCLKVQSLVSFPSEMVSYMEPETLRHGFKSDKQTFFVTPFFLNFFLSLFSFFISFFLFDIFQHYFFFIFYSGGLPISRVAPLDQLLPLSLGSSG